MRIAAITFFALFVGPFVGLTRYAAAQLPPSTSDTSRLLKSFSFEERPMGNNEDQPMNWEKIEGVAFPHYVKGRLTTDRHRSGSYSFRMDLDGASCIYRYQPGLLKVQRGTHYRFEGFCQTTVMRYARARLTAYFADQDLHPLPGTIKHSEQFASNGSDDEWHLLAVEMTADQDQAAFLVIQMELVQPDQYSTSSLGSRALFLQDVHGTAWFDDLTVSQVPEITLKTDRPGNIFRQGDPLKLSVIVNDHRTDDLAVQLMVTDALGHRVYQHTGSIDVTTAQDIGPGIREMSLDLPQVQPGWYRASLVMMSHGIYVGQESLAWILLANGGDITAPDARFGIQANELPFENWDDLPGFLPLLSVGRVKLAVWNKNADVQQLGSDKLDRLFESLQLQNISPTGCLLCLPPKLAEGFSGNSWLQLLNAPGDAWQTQLSFLISQHANRVDRWQLGADDTDEFAVNPDMRKVYSKILAQFSNLIDRPDVAMPCPLLYEVPAPAPTSLTLSVPTTILPAEIPLYVQEFHDRDLSQVALSLSLLDPATYDRETQIRDLAQRVVYALASDVPRFDLPIPMAVRQQGDVPIAEPQELAIIMRTLLSTLSGSQFRGKLPIAQDVDAFLFEKSGQGIIVMWNKNDVTDPRPITVSLGDHATQMDLWGNVGAVLQASHSAEDEEGSPQERAASGLIHLKVGRMPILLTNVDIEMNRLRASLSFDKPLLESTFQSHTRHIRFSNPYNQPVGGTLKLHAPPGWNLIPPSFDFTLNAGQSFDREFTVEFPYNSIAGPHVVNADFDLQADRHIRFSVPLVLTLGLSDVGTQCIAFRDGADAVVQQMITNYGDQPITYSAFASCPGRPRIERLVNSLNPGQTSIKKYRFTHFPPGSTPKIRVGLKEVDGARILNDEVEVK